MLGNRKTIGEDFVEQRHMFWNFFDVRNMPIADSFEVALLRDARNERCG